MPIPADMRAAVITQPGPPDVLGIERRPVPLPGPGEVLVRVRASALNRADVLQRAGRYPAPPGVPADIPGLEFAGEVALNGPGSSRWTVGARVCGLVGGGAHAEYLVTHERAVAGVPDALEWTQAGAAPEACITAHDALVAQASVRPGDTVLIHAVGSGVGLAAVQIARQLGATVFGTARTVAKLEVARELGLAQGVTPGERGWVAAAVREWTGGRGIDVVLDLVGGEYVRETVPALATHGRLVLIGTLAGAESMLDLRYMLSRRLTVRGTVLRSRPLEERIVVTHAFEREVMPWLADGTVRMRVGATLPLERIVDAHVLMESNETTGKIAIGL
ncbi:MAG TPA: NAD(P)H-quinone oxidoreductase [Gemmatimonas sp.]|nr:NAD(P)H-quinone oxidoreductase [Gemmatimonas sp.]